MLSFIAPPSTAAETAVALIALFAVSFLLGSIPWGVVISRLFFKKDIRNEGSGNIGTTNAMRSMGKVGGASVFVLDFGKGLLSGFLGLWVAEWIASAQTDVIWDGSLSMQAHPVASTALAVAFLGCVWGHIFSPWLKFKGGKGIAVAVGCLFVIFGWQGALLELAIFVVLVVSTRYVSVGSIASAIACPFISLYFYWGCWAAWALITIAAITVVWAHRGNIDRLRRGCENRIGSKKGSSAKEDCDPGKLVEGERG